MDRLGDLVGLCAAALPDELLLGEDLEAVCFDDPPADDGGGRVGPTATFGVDVDGAAVGALAVSLRHTGDLTAAHVQVVAVDPRHRRRGVGRALLRRAERWAADGGATLVASGAAAPFSLFTGVDSRWTEALCFVEATGYRLGGVELDLVCPALQRGRPAPTSSPDAPAVAVAPVRSDADVADVVAFAARHYPHWVPELRRGAEAGTAVAARDPSGAVQGAAAHSTVRAGVVGPVAVAPGFHGGGVGTAMMRAVLADLAAAGWERAEIAWTSTVRFYALACGATVGRAALQYHRWLPSADPTAEPGPGGSVAP